MAALGNRDYLAYRITVVRAHGKIRVMTTIVAIETSADLASVALLHDGALSMLTSTGAATHSQSILPMIQQLFNTAKVGLADCDSIAFGAGPGSFTGVRTACSVAQGLAFGIGVPVVAINTLEAMAQACFEKTGFPNIVTLLDARMGEVYWAQYDFSAGLKTLIEPCLSVPASVVVQGPVVACGNGLIAGSGQFSEQNNFIATHPEVMPHAAIIAKLAQRALVTGLQVAAKDAQPIYLRNQVALTIAERMQKKLQELV